jgi:hypothetical protein
MKAEIIEAATGKFIEPKHVGLVYSKMDLVRALNHYSCYAKPDSLKEWSITYLRKVHPELVPLVNKAPASSFGTFGALCRMSIRGYDHDEVIRNRIYVYFKNLAADVLGMKDKPVDDAVKVVIPKVSRSRESFEMAADETLMTGTLVMPSLIMTESHKDIVEICEHVLKDIKEYPEDYGNTKSLQLKFFKQVLEKVEKAKSVKKATSAVPKNVGKQVEGVKFLRKIEALKLRSLEPIETTACKKMYVFDAKYRRIIVFVALTNAGFQYSGTTLKNVDLKKSFSKTIRKPEEFFKKTKLNISDLNKAFDEINSKETPMIASRFNSDWLILKVTEKGA